MVPPLLHIRKVDKVAAVKQVGPVIELKFAIKTIAVDQDADQQYNHRRDQDKVGVIAQLKDFSAHVGVIHFGKFRVIKLCFNAPDSLNQCALLAAGSGLITGVGGIGTMLIGTPLDILNIIAQQFRVTLAISYHYTGKYKINFDDFFKIVATSVKADTKLALSKNVMEEVAEKILMGLGTKASRRLIPVVGGVIGGTVNYMFIKGIAKELKEREY